MRCSFATAGTGNAEISGILRRVQTAPTFSNTLRCTTVFSLPGSNRENRIQVFLADVGPTQELAAYVHHHQRGNHLVSQYVADEKVKGILRR